MIYGSADIICEEGFTTYGIHKIEATNTRTTKGKKQQPIKNNNHIKNDNNNQTMTDNNMKDSKNILSWGFAAVNNNNYNDNPNHNDHNN